MPREPSEADIPLHVFAAREVVHVHGPLAKKPESHPPQVFEGLFAAAIDSE